MSTTTLPMACPLVRRSHALPDFKVDGQTALWLVYPKSNVLTAKVGIFIDFLLEKIGSVQNWTEPA